MSLSMPMQLPVKLDRPKPGNMVILGAASPYIDMSAESVGEAIRKLFGRKGEDIVNANLKAFGEGRKFTLGFKA